MATGGVETGKLFRAILVGLAASGGGFGVAEFSDVLGARRWREENIEALMQAERDRDRLVALEAQARILTQLVADCSGIDREPTIVLPSIPDGSDTTGAAVEWRAIE